MGWLKSLTETVTIKQENTVIKTVMTKESLGQIIAQVENDPLAGAGAISKRDLLIDRLLAHWNTVQPRDSSPAPAPRPLLTEVQSPLQETLELKRTAKGG
jgi:hypothetical protein